MQKGLKINNSNYCSPDIFSHEFVLLCPVLFYGYFYQGRKIFTCIYLRISAGVCIYIYPASRPAFVRMVFCCLCASLSGARARMYFNCLLISRSGALEIDFREQIKC